jgi:D-amino-acid dehydrogenase
MAASGHNSAAMNPRESSPSRHCDVLVLGGGVIGLACALFLLRAGRSVRLLEKAAVGSGASHGNCGTITPSHLPLHAPGTVTKGLKWMLRPDAPFRIKPTLDPELLGWLLAFARRCNPRDYRYTAEVKSRLLLASRARLAQLIADEALACEFVDSGTLYVYRDAAALERAAADVALLQALGVPVRVLDGTATRALEPALNDSVVGAHHHPEDARLRPDRYVAELARAVRAAGGEIVEDASVQSFRTGDGRVCAVRTARGDFSGDQVVYALGAWSPVLARQLDLRLPIQPGKGYSITFARPAAPPLIPLVLKEASVCVTTWASGYRLGSTMEFAGYDSRLNRTRLQALTRAAALYLREPLGPRVEEEWYGWRPMTPDDLPIIGRVPGFKNLILATGHGMLGVSLSAITAQLVCELVEERRPSLDLAPLAITRFG